ncbi:MAG: DNA-protecting protein DprA [Candidatus Eisenbacteria bacterium]|nr:DNA-protecting protein DprA [Candidatus Eisenbacteria bacterium]
MATSDPEPGLRGATALSIDDPDYPPALRDLADAPRTVYVRGRIPPRERSVAIVGARASTLYGDGVAGMLARDLAALGVTIVSGLARGIDAAAHRGALEAGGWTVAVLPGGLDSVAPRHHTDLAARVAATGGLITEWETGPPRARGVFVRRNRLIAALTSAVVVVEAGEESGALSTAGAARRLERVVFAVPGDIDRPSSRGCLALLREGARVCASAADVMSALPVRIEAAASPEARLLDALAARPEGAETLAMRAGLPVDQALAALLRLEWAGTAAPCPGQRWKRTGSGGA